MEVDVSQSPIEIEAKIVNKIYDEIKSSSESFYGKGKNGYTVHLKTVGIFGQSFGRLTVTGSKSGRRGPYSGTFCSDGKLVSQVMNQYIEDLSSQVKKLYKEAALSLWNDFRSVSLLSDISEFMLKDYLQEKTEYLLQKGYGKLLANLLKMKKGDELIKKISSVKDSKSFAKVLQSQDLKEIYQEIKKIEYADKEIRDASVKNAMEKVESARKNMESALYDYLYNDDTTDDMNFIEKTKYYWKAFWQCPVDVTIYDENKKLLGIISENKGIISYADDIYMELNGDVKTVYLSKNKKVVFELSGTDEGNMNYVIEEYENGAAVGRLNYYDVPLTEGMEYSQSVEINTLPDNTAVMPLIKKDGGKVEANEYILAADTTKNVTIDGVTEGKGIIYGRGKYAIGDAVELAAISDDGYRFMGWYEAGALVEPDAVYRFTALNNVTVTALFEKIPEKVSDYKVELSEKYQENVRVALYKSGENLANIIISIYDVEKASDMEITMKKYDTDGKVTDSSTANAISDGAYRYIITDVSLQDWKTLELSDADKNLMALIKLGQIGEENSKPTETPAGTSTASPSPTPTSKPPVRPNYPNVPSGSNTPVVTPTASPSVVPTLSPVPTVSPTVIPTTVPTTVPTITPTPVFTETPEPTLKPTETPEATIKPTAKPKPSARPGTKDEDKTNSAMKIKKGSKVTDKKTKAVYKITGTGKNRTAEYTKSTRKNPSSISVPTSVKLNGKNYKVTSVGKAALKNSKKLKTVKLGKNVKKIGQQAFYGCTKLTNVSLGKNVTAIGANAFNKCIALTIITIPSRVNKIGTKAFYQCRKLRYFMVKTNKLTLGNIGKNAFGSGYGSPRVKTDKKIWERYSNVFILRGMSGKALFVIDPVKLVI